MSTVGQPSHIVTPTLVNFLNHGHLPFIGRAAESERIIALWRNTSEAQGVHAVLVVGEGGVGKSRLIEESAARIAADRGVVIHAKLFPESTASLAPLIARAIFRSAGASSIIRTEPEGTMTAVAAALRRVCRLRRTIVILEDVHLLSREPLRELAVLLENLSDDSLALVCTTRPGSDGVPAVLERYTLDELRLSGLGPDDLGRLWQAVFGEEPGPVVLELLYAATLGNLMAVRSALRGAIKRGTILADRASSHWLVSTSPAALRASFEESVRLLSEGMAVHLGEPEAIAAARLASLGEAFAREAAMRLLDDEQLIDALLFKGIIARTTIGSAQLLGGGRGASAPLAFSHTLLHRYFLQAQAPDVATLIRLIADDMPLYSTLPFQLIAAGPIDGADDAALVRASVRMTAIGGWLDLSSDWELNRTLIDALWAMLEAHSLDDAESRRRLEWQVLPLSITLERRSGSARQTELVERFLEITADPVTREECEARLRALAEWQYWLQRNDLQRWLEADSESERLIERDPSLVASNNYCTYLRATINGARAGGDFAVIRGLGTRYRRCIEHPDSSDAVRRRARRDFSMLTIDLFESQEELDHGIAELSELVPKSDVARPSVDWHFAIALYEAGRASESIALIDQIIPVFVDHGWRRTVAQAKILRACARLLLGAEVGEIAAEVQAIADGAPEAFAPMIATSLTSHLALAAQLTGHLDYAHDLVARHAATSEASAAMMIAITALLCGEPFDIRAMPAYDWPVDELAIIALIDPAEVRTVDAGLGAIRTMLSRDPYRINSVSLTWLLFAVIDDLDRRFPKLKLAQTVAPETRTHIGRTLEWLESQRLATSARALLDSPFAKVLSASERKAWTKRVSALAKAAPRPEVAGDDRVQVSMLGTIEIRKPGVDAVRPKGARLRTLLGVLCADAMLEHRLSNQDFYAIAAEESDVERARNAVYIAMHRLREMLGHSAITTDGPTPRLELGIVRVDILDASRLLNDAHAAARDADWLRASTALLATLSIVRSDVPFPGLYDDFFEALRGDFEGMLRSTAIRVTRGLLGEGDPETAEELLRGALVAMPEDEDLMSLLRDALESQGHRTEVELMRRQEGVM